MSTHSLLHTTGRRLLGVMLIAVIVGLVALSVAIYDKVFVPVVKVTLKTDHTGNQLRAGSDVKLRGIIVGSVRAVHVDSGANACQAQRTTCVSVTLALDPDRAKQIPTNVSAQILPKTLFGEQYVALQLPRHRGAPIRAGATIGQDRSKGALETEKVIGDLLPLLQAVRPADLNATLNAIATALHGRGAELGQTLVSLEHYLGRLNPHVHALVTDLAKLGRVADEYDGVAADIFATLRNLQTSTRTVVTKRVQLDALLTAATDTSATLRGFLAKNEQRLITLTGTTEKVYALLEKYSPEFTCLLGGLNVLQKRTRQMVRNDQIQLSVALDNTSLGKYTPGQQPRLVTGYGPHCFGLPHHVTPTKPSPDGSKQMFQIPPSLRCFSDGAPLTGADCAAAAAESAREAAIGSPAENTLVRTLLAGSYGGNPDNVPPVATILTAPLLRGTQVGVS